MNSEEAVLASPSPVPPGWCGCQGWGGPARDQAGDWGGGRGGGARRLPNNGTDLLVSGEAHWEQRKTNRTRRWGSTSRRRVRIKRSVSIPSALHVVWLNIHTDGSELLITLHLLGPESVKSTNKNHMGWNLDKAHFSLRRMSSSWQTPLLSLLAPLTGPHPKPSLVVKSWWMQLPRDSWLTLKRHVYVLGPQEIMLIK